jgi:hypothetical protein
MYKQLLLFNFQEIRLNLSVILELLAYPFLAIPAAVPYLPHIFLAKQNPLGLD